MNQLSRRLGLAAVTVVVASAFGCAHHDMDGTTTSRSSTDTYTGLANSTVSNGATADRGIISNTPDTSASRMASTDTTTTTGAMSSGTSSSTMVAAANPTPPSSVDDDSSKTTTPAPMPMRATRADRN